LAYIYKNSQDLLIYDSILFIKKKKMSDKSKIDIQIENQESPRSLKVLIAGAGIGGLMLGLLLERGGVDYQIFEKSSSLKPLGSAMVLNPQVLPLFEQLGL